MQGIPIKADRPRTLRYSTNAFCVMEELTGKAVMELNNGAGIIEIRAMLYSGLYWEDKELTLEDAGDILDVFISNDNLDYITEKLGEAIERALGENPKPGKKFKKKKRKR